MTRWSPVSNTLDVNTCASCHADQHGRCDGIVRLGDARTPCWCPCNDSDDYTH